MSKEAMTIMSETKWKCPESCDVRRNFVAENVECLCCGDEYSRNSCDE